MRCSLDLYSDGSDAFYRGCMGSDTPYDRVEDNEVPSEVPPAGCLSELSELCPARALGAASDNSHSWGPWQLAQAGPGPLC